MPKIKFAVDSLSSFEEDFNVEEEGVTLENCEFILKDDGNVGEHSTSISMRTDGYERLFH